MFLVASPQVLLMKQIIDNISKKNNVQTKHKTFDIILDEASIVARGHTQNSPEISPEGIGFMTLK